MPDPRKGKPEKMPCGCCVTDAGPNHNVVKCAAKKAAAKEQPE